MRERINKKKRTPKRIILAICEGETEAAYIELLKRHYRLPVVIKSKIAGNKISQRLVSQYVNELGLSKKDDCIVFFIYDMDIQDIIDTLSGLEGMAILSNPCIELWFLLHSGCYYKSATSDEIVKTLLKSSPEWHRYKKGSFSYGQQNLLLSNISVASENADKLRFPENPSSNMTQFIQILEELKNR